MGVYKGIKPVVPASVIRAWRDLDDGLRLGQRVANVYFPVNVSVPELFYCTDAEFDRVAPEYIEIDWKY